MIIMIIKIIIITFIQTTWLFRDYIGKEKPYLQRGNSPYSNGNKVLFYL